jgi:hypothetical protein
MKGTMLCLLDLTLFFLENVLENDIMGMDYIFYVAVQNDSTFENQLF